MFKSCHCYSILSDKSKQKEVNNIKEISKQDIIKLLELGIIKNTNRGYVNAKGSGIGYYRTKGSGHKRYIQDKYIDIANRL